MLRKSLSFFAVLLCVLIPGLGRASEKPAVPPARGTNQVDANQIGTGRIDETQLVMLKGNTHPLARAEFDEGSVASNLPMKSMFLLLKRGPEQQAALDRLTADQQNPASRSYHAWLSPEAVGQNYGPAQAEIDAVVGWLRSKGFTVDRVSNSRTVIEFSGDAGQVQAAFHTEIHHLNVRGVSHIANMGDPSIPAALAPVVAGVQSLNDFFARPLHVAKGVARFDAATGSWSRKTASAVPGAIVAKSGQAKSQAVAKPEFGIVDAAGGQLELVSPYDFATIYNVLPLWQATSAIDGTGQTIAIAGTSNIVPSDVASFRSFFGLPAKAPTVIVTNNDPGTSSADDLLENSLDVEWSGAVARGAAIKLVTSSATATTDALSLSEEYIVDHNVAPVMSVSYGECELGLGTAGNLFLSTLWQQAQAQGIAVFVASGDEGSAMCDGGTDTVPSAAEFGLAVNGFASTPYNVAVGGTDFNWLGQPSTYWGANNAATEANALGYIPEVPWNDTCTNPLVIGIIYPGHTAEATCNAAADSNNDYSLVTVEGGGGGKSACTSSNGSTLSSCAGGYAKPAWQAGVIGIPADNARDLPDVSFFAAPGLLGSAYPVCVSSESPDGTCNFSNTTDVEYLVVGGTSASSPAMAGVMAMVNQWAGTAQGNPNAELYYLASLQNYFTCSAEYRTPSSVCYFNDIDTGTNAMPCYAGSANCAVNGARDLYGVLSGWGAGPGYDLATGLGSLNVANVVKAWPVAVPEIGLSATSLVFAGTTVKASAATQTVTVSNSGGSALALTTISISGTSASSFSESSKCPASLAAGASCAVTVGFTPLATGALSAMLLFTDNAGGSPQSVALGGTGIAPAPAASLSPLTLNFAATTVGTAAVAQTLTLKNSGTAVLKTSGLAITGANASAFSFSNVYGCPASLAAGANCAVAVGFKPNAVGALSAMLSITDNAPGSPQSATLSGTGVAAVPAATLSVTALAFPAAASGSKVVPAQGFTIANTGTAALTVSSIGLTGTGDAAFTQLNNCAGPIGVGAECWVLVQFAPATAGSFAAGLTVSDNASGSPQTVSLAGTGGGPPSVSLSQTTLGFGTVAVGTASTGMDVLLSNAGATTMFPAGMTLSGSAPQAFQFLETCGASVAPGTSCNIMVVFTPPAAGTFTATLTVTAANPTASYSLALSGTGR